MAEEQGEIELEYGRDEKPPTAKALLLGLQHVAVMLVPATAVA
jgi:NCS2 family nucleobase:cation symporter-2